MGAVAALSAQEQQPPRFQTGVELTRLEISVLNKDTRKPVRGLKASDFVVKVLRPAGRAIAGQESLATLFPGTPTAVRVFRKGDRVTAVLRAHQTVRTPPQPVVLDTMILDAAGSEVHAGTRELAAGSFAEINGAEHRFELPLAALEPGDYLLRFIASSGRNHVQRDVRFSVVR